MKLFDLSDGLADIFEEIALMPQPVFIYYYSDGGDDYVLVSQNEIDEDDLDNVFQEKIEDYLGEYED